jgi:hypothetical protein
MPGHLPPRTRSMSSGGCDSHLLNRGNLVIPDLGACQTGKCQDLLVRSDPGLDGFESWKLRSRTKPLLVHSKAEAQGSSPQVRSTIAARFRGSYREGSDRYDRACLVPDESSWPRLRRGTIRNSALRHRRYRPRNPLSPPRPLFAPWLLAPALLPPALRELRLLFVRSEAELRALALRPVPLAFVSNWPEIFLSVLVALARNTRSLRVADMLPAELLRLPLAWVLAR